MTSFFNYIFIKQVNIFKLLILLIISQVFVYGQARDYKLIFSINLLQNMKIEDAIATTKILAKKIQQKRELKEEINIIVTDNLNDLINEIKQPFDFILATSVETDLIKRKYNIEPVLINQNNGNFGFEYYLITNTSNNYNDLNSLRGKKINILCKSELHVASVWLDKLLRDEKLPAKEKFFKEIKYDYKANNIVLPVYFNKVDAAIVSKPAYDLLNDLNPQIQKQIKIVVKSEPLLFGVISFDGRSKDKKRKEMMLDILQTLHEENYGKQLLDLFAVEKIIPYKEEYWQKYLNLYK